MRYEICNNCGMEIDMLSDDGGGVCDKCEGTFCNDCFENHKC